MIDCRNVSYKSGSWSSVFSFTADEPEWIGVAGPSGSGKSTLLKILSGLLPADSGECYIDQHSILTKHPSQRYLSTMFQTSCLLEHLTCRKNLELALINEQGTSQIKVQRIAESLGVACLEQHFLDRYPQSLSGGELARMNLAMAVLRATKWLLLDEPFAAIDQDLRTSILTRLNRWRNASKIGIILVSHDPADALLMADRLLFIESGRVSGFGSPSQLAEHPPTLTMAKLLKRGTVFEYQGRPRYVIPENVYTSKQQMQQSGAVMTFDVRDFKRVVTSATQVILDLDRGINWLLPLDRSFEGKIFLPEQFIHDFS
jgi:ABC-type sulfate/molybdate transport systems ATPase subunit